eukprot:NODE_533_length_1836_cov_53.767115_g525_i0.p1 GENE.NODE_533_length_1836_cov_53.767115_g525_i0~~NODE_533_length_1836_cov_53.767115_g525_i0.p1  ORF type:complete len:549 (-),score=170.94 NODE_533_length_1836_cov_53.767115_g525_i0:190-1770(-)
MTRTRTAAVLAVAAGLCALVAVGGAGASSALLAHDASAADSIDVLTAGMIEQESPWGPLVHALRTVPVDAPVVGSVAALVEVEAERDQRRHNHQQQQDKAGSLAPAQKPAAPGKPKAGSSAHSAPAASAEAGCGHDTKCPVKGWVCCGEGGNLCCPKDMTCVAASQGQLPFCTPRVHLDEKDATPSANATWIKENDAFREGFKKRSLREEFSKQQEEGTKGTLNAHEEEVKNYKSDVEEREKAFERQLEERWKTHGRSIQVHRAGAQQERKDRAAAADKAYLSAKHKEELLKSRYFLEVQARKIDRKATLVLHYKQSSHSSNGWLDYSRNNNNLFVRNGAHFNKDGSLNVRGAMQHGIVKFDAKLQPKSAKHPHFSAEVWFKPSSLSVTNGGGLLLGQEGAFYLELGLNGHVQVMVPGTHPNGFLVSTHTIPNHKMAHVAYSFDGKQHVLYLNGAVELTRAHKHIGKPARNHHLLSIGALHSKPAQRKFRGDIYAVRYYDSYALQSSDIVVRWQHEAPAFKIKLED